MSKTSPHFVNSATPSNLTGTSTEKGDIRSGLFVVVGATVVMFILHVLLMLLRRRQSQAQ